MKKQYILNEPQEFEFIALAINSHSKGYSLCWSLNKELGLNFEKKKDHSVANKMFFSKYSSFHSEGEAYQLLSNRSKEGYLISSLKQIDYFLIIGITMWNKIKKEFLKKLNNMNSILLVFELELNKILHANRLIIND